MYKDNRKMNKRDSRKRGRLEELDELGEIEITSSSI